MRSGKKTFFSFRIAATLVLVLSCSILFTRMMNHYSQQKVLNTLSELSNQSVLVLQKEVDKEQKILTNLSSYISQGDEFNIEKIIARLSYVNQKNSFKRMGIILPDGTACTTDSVSMDLSGRAYFSESLSGISAVSDTLYDKADDQFITVYSSPLYFKEEIKGVLFATYSTLWYEKALSTSTFNGNGYSYVVKADGTCIVDSPHASGLKALDNLFVKLSQEHSCPEEALTQLKKNMANGRSGSMIYRNTEEKYLYYQPLSINDWYLLTVVPVSVIQRDLNGTLALSYVFTILCVIAFLFLLYQLIKTREVSRKALEQIAFVDPLTGGSTYDKFKMDTQSLLSSGTEGYYLVCLNIERFRDINAQYGYDEGDRALQYIWNTLNASLKNQELLTRQTADHFILLLCGKDNQAICERLDEILKMLAEHKDFQGKYYVLKPNFGIYEITENKSVDFMADLAKLALNSIKHDVFHDYAFYNEQLRMEQNRFKTLENRFEKAIRNHEFIVWYQPKYNIKRQCFDGSEALVRWYFPDLGMISPAEFIPVFERNGAILELDLYIFKEVCIKIRQWLDAGLPVTPVSVNLSRLHLYQTDFIDQYLITMEQYNIPTELIQLELTETTLFENKEIMLELLNCLHAKGIKILMDDFGSGYTSVLMLKDVPIDILKIDKGLIDDFESSEKGISIIRNIIHLSHELNIRIVAEGVETEAQYLLLKDLGCDYIQGYYFSKPLPVDQYEKLVFPDADLRFR
ncbi:GGDEF domain-containing protein [Clostridium sp. chh4-2]|nr:GGDEF domain-containing protein [Clostridium sp. chh4-2]